MYVKEDATENLLRMYEDNKKLEEGLLILTKILKKNLPNNNVNLLLVDIDGSDRVRKKGIEEKISLVEQVKSLLRTLLTSNCTLIDVGTRDEVYIVIENENSEYSKNFAELVRSTIENHLFKFDSDTINLTASIGVCDAPRFGSNAPDIIHAVDEALLEAKKTKNTVYILTELPFESLTFQLTKDQSDMLTLMANHLGRTEDSLMREAFKRLENKHKALWHWGVEEWHTYKKFKL